MRVRWLCIWHFRSNMPRSHSFNFFLYVTTPDIKWNENRSLVTFNVQRHKSKKPDPTRMWYFYSVTVIWTLNTTNGFEIFGNVRKVCIWQGDKKYCSLNASNINPWNSINWSYGNHFIIHFIWLIFMLWIPWLSKTFWTLNYICLNVWMSFVPPSQTI